MILNRNRVWVTGIRYCTEPIAIDVSDPSQNAPRVNLVLGMYEKGSVLQLQQSMGQSLHSAAHDGQGYYA